MLNEICQYLKNYFDVNDDHVTLPSWSGTFTISEGKIDLDGKIMEGQFFRIQNSIFNNGVFKYPAKDLVDETFTGKIQAMAVPKEVEEISTQVEEWVLKFGGADSAANSPYNSESFAGYSYSKGGTSSESSDTPAWWAAFGGRLARYRKL